MVAQGSRVQTFEAMHYGCTPGPGFWLKVHWTFRPKLIDL
jgi:hypothetical protein